jgi:glycosyltransferase involved in cell wall biosynthesis
VVHTHQIGALFYAGPAARAAGVPVVVHTEHGHHEYRGRTRWMAWWAARYAQRVFCVSADIASSVVDRGTAPLSKVQVVSNGIDVASFANTGRGRDVKRSLGIPSDAPVIGTVGRLNEIKRQDVLIHSFELLKSTEHQAHLLFVGDGPMRRSLCRLAEDLGLEQRVHFAGYQDDPAPFLNAMNVFALTSRSEGMPLCVLEAWAAGLPVVASRVGGIPELIEHGCNGLMFEKGDVAGLSTHLTSLLTDPERACRMGQAGRERVVARFDVSVMANEYDRHYQELLATNDVPVSSVEPAAGAAVEAH